MSDLQTAAVVAVATIPIAYAIDSLIAAARRRRGQSRSAQMRKRAADPERSHPDSQRNRP